MTGRVLVVPRTAFADLPVQGTWPCRTDVQALPCEWLPRAQAETDERYLQIIAYGLIRDAEQALWCYERVGGDPRVRQRLSCGVGGHVDETDWRGSLPASAGVALQRELGEELGWQPQPAPALPSVWLYEGLSAIGRVHIGLVYPLRWVATLPPVPVPGEPLRAVGFCAARQVASDMRFERWSRLAAQWLDEA
jgi:predicted NUDIX family phosphoesterase